MRPAVPALAAAMSLACLLASCGGDGGSGDSDGEAASRFRAQGNAICKESLDKAPMPSPARTPEEIADQLEELLEFNEPYDRRLDRLEPPPELQDDFEESVRIGDRSERMFRGFVADLRAVEGPAALGRLQERFERRLERSVKSTTEAFRRLGLKECILKQSPDESSREAS